MQLLIRTGNNSMIFFLYLVQYSKAIFKIVVHKERLDEWNLGQYLNVMLSGIFKLQILNHALILWLIIFLTTNIGSIPIFVKKTGSLDNAIKDFLLA